MTLYVRGTEIRQLEGGGGRRGKRDLSYNFSLRDNLNSLEVSQC